MIRRTRQSEITGKISARCRHVEGGEQCDKAVYAHGYCWQHQGKLRRRRLALMNFYQTGVKLREQVPSESTPDDCSRCHGERGGARGNENVVDGVLLCDYCHADDLRATVSN
ncbi:MAG TPA: hypothetical protein VGQ52_13870 [Gemmatimonadaceae bacterium]|jgi:hypothetical protein|nr:hypothetical protein [Gemmatimonadaceae bacterium]